MTYEYKCAQLSPLHPGSALSCHHRSFVNITSSGFASNLVHWFNSLLACIQHCRLCSLHKCLGQPGLIEHCNSADQPKLSPKCSRADLLH